MKTLKIFMKLDFVKICSLPHRYKMAYAISNTHYIKHQKSLTRSQSNERRGIFFLVKNR